MKSIRNSIIALCIFAAWLTLRAQNPSQPPATAEAQVIDVDHGPNSAAAQAKNYVILVSLDGFRYDYATKFGAPHLQSMAAAGASAPEGMIPSFPSITFPNHLSIVTGLYPEHHGIVENNFYDPARKETYHSSGSDTVRDGTWYSGVPLWVLAEKHGMRSACFFWPGSEAEIDGMRPSHYVHYDNAVPDEKRIEQVIAWLKLPRAQRPHFITLYYYQPDHTGHQQGPDSPLTGEAVHHVDDLMGVLMADLKTVDLPVNVIVVSDHGMATVEGNWIDLDHYADLTGFVTLKNESLLYAPDEQAAQRVYQELKGKSDKFVVYRRRDLPARLHLNESPRAGDPVVIPTGPYMIRAHAAENPEVAQPDVKGEHGYDPSEMKTMRAIFYAEGPDIRRGAKVPPFANIDLYPMIARILGLPVGHIDGQLGPLAGVLQPKSSAANQKE